MHYDTFWGVFYTSKKSKLFYTVWIWSKKIRFNNKHIFSVQIQVQGKSTHFLFTHHKHFFLEKIKRGRFQPQKEQKDYQIIRASE